MILYVTKQTVERYKLKMPEELSPPMDVIAKEIMRREQGDPLLEWGGKLFYFDRRKCIQFVNFASKFTLFLVDIKVSELPLVGNTIAQYLMDIYGDNAKMRSCLEKLFEEAPFCCFAKLTDKSAIATLNHTQRAFAFDGYRFYDYIEKNILKTRKINRDVNFDYPFTRKQDGKTEYFYPGERYKELLFARYGLNKGPNP